jgi:hypothetical protein
VCKGQQEFFSFPLQISLSLQPAGSKKCTEKPMTIACISNNPKIKEQSNEMLVQHKIGFVTS